MKRISLFLFLLTLGYMAAAQPTRNRFVLNGKVLGAQTGWMYLYYTNSKGARQMDSTALKDGGFSFNGAIAEPVMAYLSLKEEKRTQNNAASFFLEPSVITAELVLNQFGDAQFTGSKTQHEYAALYAKRLRVKNRWQVVMDTLSAVNKRSNVEYQELKDWVLQPYNAEMRALDFAFFEQHPRSYVTANMMRYYVSSLSLDALQMLSQPPQQSLQLTAEGKEVANEI
jgi:hypothetical protein